VARKGSPKLRFSSAGLYIDRGKKLTVTKTMLTKSGRRTRVRVISYVPNKTVRRVPAAVRLSLIGQKRGAHTVTAKFLYTYKVRKDGRSRTVRVTKRIRLKFTVC
jgi:hypothetical protein